MVREYTGDVKKFLNNLKIKNNNELYPEIDKIMTRCSILEISKLFLSKDIYTNTELLNYIYDKLYIIDFAKINFTIIFDAIIYTAPQTIFNSAFYNSLGKTNINISDFLVYLEDHDYTNYISQILNYSLKNYTDSSQVNSALEYAIKKNYNVIIYENFKTILTKCDDLFTLNNLLKDDEKIGMYVREYIKYNQDKYMMDLLYNCFIKMYGKRYVKKNSTRQNKEIIDLNQQQIVDFFLYLFKEVARNENVSISDTKIIGNGGYSYIYQLGNKVIKIGKSRGTSKFPNNPYIVQPLLRKEIKNINNTSTLVFVEVCELVENVDLDIYEIYPLYKKIREIGLIWTDVKSCNIGRLNKDNIIHWGERLNPSDKSLNLKDKIGNETLKKGELVVLDNDFIYNENSLSIKYPLRTLQGILEARYQKEQKIKAKRK